MGVEREAEIPGTVRNKLTLGPNFESISSDGGAAMVLAYDFPSAQ